MKYPKPPIIEAVLDIRARLDNGVGLDTLAAARVEEYPVVRDAVQFQLEFKAAVGEEPSASHDVNVLGFAYRSVDDKRIYQVRKDGFSHNQLAPYSAWVDFVGEARRLWAVYKRVAHPDAVELLGLTYVNRLSIPDGIDMSHYLNAYPVIPKSLPQQVSSFSSAFQVGAPDGINQLHVSQTLGPPSDGSVFMILNVQAFRPIDRPLDDLSDDEIWGIFEQLHTAKNQAFEACITDRTREAFY